MATKNSEVKTYASKASAVRAAKKSDFAENYSINKGVDGRWCFSEGANAAPAPAKKVAKKAAPEKAAPAERRTDILRASAFGGVCAYVWELADQMIAEGFTRKDVLEKCREEGVAFYTARTQYQKWYTARNKK